MSGPVPTTAIETPQDVFERVCLERVHMPRRLRTIADALIEEPGEFAILSITEVAERLEVSPSAIVRFAQSLGFSGFTPLQKMLRRGLVEGTSYRDRARGLGWGGQGGRSDIDYVLRAFAAANIRAIQEAEDTIDGAALGDVVAALRAARLIGVVGQKRAFPLASYLFYGLARLELDAILLDGAGGMLERQAAALSERDALVAISFAPYAPAVREVSVQAADRGVRVLAITDAADSPLVALAHRSILVAEANLNDIRSIAVTSTVIQAVFVALGLKDAGARSRAG